MKIKSIVAGLLLACAYAAPSLAYTFIDYCGSTPVRWSGASKTFSAASSSFPTSSAFYTALQTAMARVTDPINFTLAFTNADTSVAIGNGQSEVWFSSDATHSPAVAYNYITCTGGSYISESDVVFYTGEPYTANMATSGLYGYGGSSRPFQTTAVHELGHAINLMHINTEYNIMGQDYYHIHANGGLARAYLGEDGADGAIYLYGSNGRQDLSLAHWKWVGSSGQYSMHGHTKLYNSSGTELPSFLDAGESRFDVTGGQVIQMELTAENNGASSQTTQIGFYLSNNNAIATSDTLITTQSRTVARDNVDTYKATITVPAGLASGNYWLGAIIDNGNTLSEGAEDNNATYFPIRYTASGGGGANTPPVANFNFTTSGLTATFTDASTDANGTIASRSWNFGDSTTSTAASPSKTYSAAGTRTVILTVTDNQGATASVSKSVTVSTTAPPTLVECTASDVNLLGKNCKRSNRSAALNNYNYMYISLPAGVPQLKITVSGGTGNANLYYSASSWATTSNYQYSSVNSGNSETLTITNPPSGYVYISLHAATAFSGVTVSTQY